MKFVRIVSTTALVFVAVLAALVVVKLLPDSLNPFSTQTIDRSPPPVLQSIESIGEYRASSANLQLVVDLTKDTRFVPDFIKGERTLFVAAGSVDAGVDFAGLDASAVEVNADRTAVVVTLPPARLFDPEVDIERSSVVSRDRGVFDRLADAVGEGDNQREMLLLAERKLRDAAAADPRVRQQAEANTRVMLTTLLQSLGFRDVTVRFQESPSAT